MNFSYSVQNAEYSSPLRVGGRSVSQRPLIQVLLRPSDRRVFKESAAGIGYCAPLPGLHDESIEDVARSLVSLGSSPSPQAIEDLISQTPFPSLAFGLDEARARLGSDLRFDRVPVNALVISGESGGPGSPEGIAATVESIKSRGFQVVKVKIGDRPLPETVQWLRSFSGLLPGVRLRLDANRRLSITELAEYGTALSTLPIEYYEEPLKLEEYPEKYEEESGIAETTEIKRLHRLYNECHLPIALDESLEDFLAADLPMPKSVVAWVLKPTRIGTFQRTFELIRRAKELGLGCVLSSAYDPGLSIITLAWMAQKEGLSHAQGLDTFQFLKGDPWAEKLEIKEGHLLLK